MTAASAPHEWEPHESGEGSQDMQRNGLQISFAQVMNGVLGVAVTVSMTAATWFVSDVRSGIAEVKKEIVDVKLELARSKSIEVRLEEFMRRLGHVEERLDREKK